MSKLSILTGALAALLVLLSFTGALCGAVVREAEDVSLYGARSREAVREAMGLTSEEETTAYIGLDAAEQEAFAQEMAVYMASGSGTAQDAPERLNEREAMHMADVRGLIAACDKAKTLCASLAGALAVAMAWTGVRLKRRRRTVLLGALIGAGLLALSAGGLLLAVHAAGFERAFVALHELLFSNDLWLLNPETDMLIRMMPQLLFERAAVYVAWGTLGVFGVMLAMLFAVYALVGGMSRRQLTEKKS